MMKKPHPLAWIGIFILLLSLALLVWSFWPPARVQLRVPLPAIQTPAAVLPGGWALPAGAALR